MSLRGDRIKELRASHECATLQAKALLIDCVTLASPKSSSHHSRRTPPETRTAPGPLALSHGGNYETH